MFPNWQLSRRLRSSSRKLRQAARARRRARGLRFEPLEARELLAVADATLGVLEYTAADGETNNVTLSDRKSVV